MESLRRVSRLVSFGSNVQFLQGLLSLGVAGMAVAVAVRIATLNHWLNGASAAIFFAGLFLVFLSLLLTSIPHVFHPSGPFGSKFGNAALLVGSDDERNRAIFARAPLLRKECFRVAKGLREFGGTELAKLPSAPANLGQLPDDSPERLSFNNATTRALQRFDTLYRNSWSSRIEPLLIEARSTFFGPVPVINRFGVGQMHPQAVQQLATDLESLANAIPASYTDDLHDARVERLRRLRRDGLSFAADLGDFMLERQQAATAAYQHALPSADGDDHHAEWRRNVDLSAETEALFSAKYGGTLLRILGELQAFGFSDESISRLLGWGSHALRVSSYDLAGLAGLIASLCQRIPYD